MDVFSCMMGPGPAVQQRILRRAARESEEDGGSSLGSSFDC
jgi:hypothetical protein